MFGPEVDAAARRHAIEVYPRESCGVVVGGVYVPLPNVAADTAEEFQLPADALVDHGPVQAIIHSHCAPRHGLWPSAKDMENQCEVGLPYGIVLAHGSVASDVLWWGDFRLDEPLVGREFVPGVLDCYSLIRSEFWQRLGMKLPEFPRDDEWWHSGGDLYRQGFAEAGFHEIASHDAREGDVVLFKVLSPVPNHGGVIVGNGLLLHHLFNRLSRREPLGPWRKMATHWLRRKD